MDNQVVIITGASTGIGANTAEYLAARGARLVLAARSKDKLTDVKARCVAKGMKDDDVLTVTADVAKTEDISALVKAAVDKFGRIDHLINNAAAFAFEDVENATVKAYELVMNTNLRAPLFLSKEAMPYLKKTKGSIVNISSTFSAAAEYVCSAYCISKAALEHLTRLLALEVAGDGVRVNAVAPGFVVTDTMLYSFPEEKKAEMEQKFIGSAKSSQPLGGGVRMSAVASTIHFLLTDAACAITGECVRVDNGYHIAKVEGVDFGDRKNTGLVNSAPTQDRQAKGK